MTTISKPQKITSINQLTYLKNIEDFTANLQKGDLGLSFKIQYGIVLYGQSKTGKTVTGHILSGNPLRGQKKDGQDVVQAMTSRNCRAKIGNQGNSQTQIPNFFQVKLNSAECADSKVFVIDTPGYADTNGVLKILSNGYYHYRLYSKVINIKFILCFDRKDISNTAEKFIDTIKQFTSYFKDYLQVKESIWESCAFLITKVQQTENTLKDLQEKFLNLIQNLNTQLLKNQEQALKELVRYVIMKKKIFYIKKFRRGESTDCRGLLQNIDRGISKWWHREYNQQKKIVDMSSVQFSLAKQVILDTTRHDKSKSQFLQLVSYYNIRIRQFVQKKQSEQKTKKNISLGFVLKQLVKDAMGSPDSHQFLELMENYVKLYYEKYDSKYMQERQKRQIQLFSLCNQQQAQYNHNSNKAKRLPEKNYVVKKFDALLHIQDFKKEINLLPQTNRILWLQDCQTNIYSIIKQFNKISFKRTKSAQIIYKYGYLIHRIIEEAKIFVLLLEVYAPKEIRQQVIDLCDKKPIDLNRQLKDFMGLSYSYKNEESLDSKDLYQEFIKDFDIQKVDKKLTINETLVEFFSRGGTVQDLQIMKKIVRIILKYSDRLLKQIQDKQQINLQQKNRLIKRLSVSRVNLQEFFYNTQGQQKIQIAMIIRNITSNLGKLLEHSTRYSLARKVYKTIRYVQSCCRMYRLQIKEDKSEDVKLRIDFSNYLADHFRQDQAIEMLQETFQTAVKASDLKLVKQEISDLRIKKRECAINQYEQSLFNEEYFVEFSDDLISDLMD